MVASKNNMVRRHTKDKDVRDIIPAPLAQGEYVECMGAVDDMDHDCAYYSTSLKTHRYYLRIMFWAHDRVPHALFHTVIGLAKAGIGPEKWKTYVDNREKFQIDLGIDLLNRALKLAFEELEEGEDRPDFMRKHPFVPCDCDQCYFCKNNYTNGIAHADKMIAEYGDKSSGKRKRVVTDCDGTRETLDRLAGKGGQECKVCMDT